MCSLAVAGSQRLMRIGTPHHEKYLSIYIYIGLKFWWLRVFLGENLKETHWYFESGYFSIGIWTEIQQWVSSFVKSRDLRAFLCQHNRDKIIDLQFISHKSENRSFISLIKTLKINNSLFVETKLIHKIQL